MTHSTYDKDAIKNSLTLEQIENILNDFEADPDIRGDVIVSRTVCHNNCGCGSHKLYYYGNTNLFKCYTDCGGDAFDIFELTRKVMSREHPKQREESEWNLPEAIEYIAQKFGFAPIEEEFDLELATRDDFTIIKNYDRIKEIDINTQEVELKEYDDAILHHLPHPIITPWLREGIDPEVIKEAEICFNPKSQAIVIPHRDVNNRLVGVRERTLVEENIELYGKYRPAYINGQMYNHPLSFNLYNFNHSKENIKRFKKAFVFEGEKSPLLYRSYFGDENDLSVAICGSSFIAYQCWLLINAGAEEIIICLDKQYQELGDKEHEKLVKNLKNIHKKYGRFVKISYMFDKGNLLDYKDSPIDKSKEVFLELYNNKFSIY